MEPLVQSTDMTGFRGAPYAAKVLTAAAEAVRTECEWHIAPVITQTVRIRTGGRGVVLLPTLKLVDVLTVTSSQGEPITGYDFYDHGVLERAAGFPPVIDVEFTHGYTTCPEALFPIIAERAQSQALGRIKSEALAGRSLQLEGGYDLNTSAVLAKFKLGAQP